jgi:hypothetical protein
MTQKVNPGARGGATGAISKQAAFTTKEYQLRAENATSLCLAIRACEPDDALPILTAATADIRDKAAFGGNPLFRQAVQEYRAGQRRARGAV